MQLTKRRTLFALGTTGLLLPRAFANTRSPLRPTPAQTEGPFYPVSEPKDADFDLLRNGNLHYLKGKPSWVEGTVTDMDGMALRGAVVEIWQCDEAGHYDHPRDGGKSDPSFQAFGRVTLGADGKFRFRTIRPVAYSGRTPHIHAKVKLGTRELLTTQFYVQGDPGNARDFIWGRLTQADKALVTVPYDVVSDGLRAFYSVVVRT